jgi:hypothetical protein
VLSGFPGKCLPYNLLICDRLQRSPSSSIRTYIRRYNAEFPVLALNSTACKIHKMSQILVRLCAAVQHFMFRYVPPFRVPPTNDFALEETSSTRLILVSIPIHSLKSYHQPAILQTTLRNRRSGQDFDRPLGNNLSVTMRKLRARAVLTFVSHIAISLDSKEQYG